MTSAIEVTSLRLFLGSPFIMIQEWNDFGPWNMNKIALDPDTSKNSAQQVRTAKDAQSMLLPLKTCFISRKLPTFKTKQQARTLKHSTTCSHLVSTRVFTKTNFSRPANFSRSSKNNQPARYPNSNQPPQPKIVVNQQQQNKQPEEQRLDRFEEYLLTLERNQVRMRVQRRRGQKPLQLSHILLPTK